MKVRDSGMPERDYWEKLLDVPKILDGLGINRRVRSAVEVGCGYGTFTVPVARRISGTLHTFDIEPEMVAFTAERARVAGVRNVEVRLRDVLAEGFGIPPGSVDAVLLFNIIHAENPQALLRSSAELLSTAGRILVIHWRSDVATPRGPDLSIRPRPEQIIEWANRTGVLVPEGAALLLPPWHYGLCLKRAAR